ncbi:MAG: NAD(P)/FAD-dependent oxidoreductase [Verrucomicrobiaceae bacterium]|nr:NAD(P)/FAD-dependent oxidoreductase [Verrucomicrobiaceae bacterium]
MIEKNADVVVIGGGPAGATAAALLAEQGHDVTVLEKSKFPRYHVGESLMPFCYHTLDRLGLVGEMDKVGFTQKFSVQFVTQDGQQSRPFYFFQHYDHPSSTTWQVLRSQFDGLILDRARDNGARVHELTSATSLIEENGNTVGVRAVTEDGSRHEISAPMVIDASGRDAFAQTKRKWRKRDPRLGKIAIWTYYKGAQRDPGLDAGSTTVAYIPEKGWFWYIPLANDIVSLGVVAERDYLYRESTDPGEILSEEIKNNVWISEHLKSGEQFGRYWTTGEYSYRSEFCASNGLLLAGDAFAFLDPVFSSGVFLALKSGEMAADVVHKAIGDNDFSASQFSEYGRELCQGIESMRALVYAFYDQGFSFSDLIKAHPEVRGDLTDCLIGNLSTDFRDLFDAVSNFAQLPPRLDYGEVLS